MKSMYDKLKELYIQALRIDTPVEEIPDANLVDQLGIDSIVSLEILIYVENEFKITFDDEDLSPKLVDSLDYLSAYILKKQIPVAETEKQSINLEL